MKNFSIIYWQTLYVSRAAALFAVVDVKASRNIKLTNDSMLNCIKCDVTVEWWWQWKQREPESEDKLSPRQFVYKFKDKLPWLRSNYVTACIRNCRFTRFFSVGKTFDTGGITNGISIKIADSKFVSVSFLSASSDSKPNGQKVSVEVGLVSRWCLRSTFAKNESGMRNKRRATNQRHEKLWTEPIERLI